MEPSGAANLPHVDASLDPIRAAIRLVADGDAWRVTVHDLVILPFVQQGA